MIRRNAKAQRSPDQLPSIRHGEYGRERSSRDGLPGSATRLQILLDASSQCLHIGLNGLSPDSA